MRERFVLLPACALWLAAALCAAEQPKKPLAIVNAALLEAEDGFAAPADAVYQPGETLYLAFNVQGYTPDRNNKVKLTYSIDGLDFKGIPFVPPDAGKVDTELSPQDAKWMPRVRFSPTLPPFADSGKYRFVIHVTDEVARREVALDLPFEVRGRAVEPSATLVVRNFHFSRQEDGEPLAVPAYRRGDVLWASFDMTGYRTGEKNLVDVEYRLSVLNAEGKVIFEQPDAAQDRSSSFYPRRYVHAVFNLNLERGIQPGQYTIVLKVRDQLGDQSCEGRGTFSVE